MLLLGVFFAAWVEAIKFIVARRAELAAKTYARYQNQTLTKTFLAWQAEAQRTPSTASFLRRTTSAISASSSLYSGGVSIRLIRSREPSHPWHW